MAPITLRWRVKINRCKGTAGVHYINIDVLDDYMCLDTKKTNGLAPVASEVSANLRHHSAIKAAEAGKSTHRRYAHIRTREALKLEEDLEASFAWAPSLSAKPRDADDDLLAGAESISPDEITAESAVLEELKKIEEVQNINKVEVLEENAFDFFQRGIIPQAILDEAQRDVLLGAGSFNPLRGLAGQIRILRRVVSQPKFLQQSTSVSQGSPTFEHALTNIDAAKATTTARKEKRIFCTR
ncbi:uncharacterized protein F5147DRAFT_769928 [Suillus discolor]|uniref:Uncharacterized protein n=1 Tax=Suillus discolor TaxID=1912936 RepID=A0A9P7JXN5_9AGAM|nr:uncharacterized protein F5147DRAFT_769928 [Suillus discolor]KAG2114613.1 hypothetical protein F5147DRAFT_769928 [Suillus discolor]